MNVETLNDPNSIHKGKKTKNKLKNTIYKKFDSKGFLYAWGFAIAFAVIGIYIINSVQTPESISESIGNPNNQSLSVFRPESVKESLAFILASLFILGAVYCIFIGLKIVALFIVGKRKKIKKLVSANFHKSKFQKLLSNKTSISE